MNRWLAAVALAVPLALAACGGTGPTQSCAQPPEAVRPDSAGALDESSSGAYCLAVGTTIDVYLHAEAATRPRWPGIVSSAPDILAAQRTGVLTPPVGVTVGIFGGLRPGTASLSSVRPDGRKWSVTVVVR